VIECEIGTRREVSFMYQHRVDVFAERMLGYTLDAKQMEILGCGYDEIQMLWSRQTGKTELVAMIAAHGAVFDMPLTLIVSGGERQAQIVQDRVTEHVRRLGRDSEAEWQDLPHHSGYAPADVFAERIEIVRCSARLLQLGNDHRVVSAPASPATIRGFIEPMSVCASPRGSPHSCRVSGPA
jgi:hypothetical protein